MIADWIYPAAPFVAWLAAGSLKFVLNSWRQRAPAFGQIGLGHFPSNHSTIVSTVATLVALREGAGPMLALALALAFIVVLDALDLRRKLGQHAAAINALAGQGTLRERLGHTPVEVAGGIALGVAIGAVLSRISF